MRSISTPNQDPRANGAVPKYIVHHHMATTGFEGVLRSWATGSKQGSCHIAIANSGERVRVVPNHLRAWSLSSEFFDSQALVTEIANQSIGGNWPVSQAAHEAAAQQTAEWCVEFGIPCDRQHVIGHREVYTRFDRGYATACPGGLNLDWIVARALEIIRAGGGQSAPASTPASTPARPSTPASSSTWEWVRPSKAVQKAIQQALKNRGRYSGLVDGDWGPLSIAAIQLTLRNVGYTGDLDGKPGINTCHYVQVYAQRFGSYTGPVDNKLGQFSWDGFLLGLQRP